MEPATGSDDGIDIPENSVVDTESSDGQGHIFEDEAESDGDHDKDEDYVMEDRKSESDPTDSEDELYDDHHEPTPSLKKGKGKTVKVSLFSLCLFICDIKTCQNLPKPLKGDFRREINNARTFSAIAGNTALNPITKMKPLTAQKRKEPLGENKPP